MDRNQIFEPISVEVSGVFVYVLHEKAYTRIYPTFVLKLVAYASMRQWCNGYHRCFPSSGSGFDSRLAHFFIFFSFYDICK